MELVPSGGPPAVHAASSVEERSASGAVLAVQKAAAVEAGASEERRPDDIRRTGSEATRVPIIESLIGPRHDADHDRGRLGNSNRWRRRQLHVRTGTPVSGAELLLAHP